MTAEPERRGATSTDIERTAHAYCALCNPDPRPGQPITALCGATHPFWGRRERPVNTCPACYALASEAVYQCGHAAQGM